MELHYRRLNTIPEVVNTISEVILPGLRGQFPIFLQAPEAVVFQTVSQVSKPTHVITR